MTDVVRPNFSSSAIKITSVNYNVGGVVNAGVKEYNSKYQNIDYSNPSSSLVGLEEGYMTNQAKETNAKLTVGKVLSGAATTLLSVGSGTLNIVETIGDGLYLLGAQLGSAIFKGTSMVSKYVFNNEEAANNLWQYSLDIEDTAKQFIQYDWSEAVYSNSVDFLSEHCGLDKDIAYGKLHSYVDGGTTALGYVAIGIATGGAGAAVMTGVGAVSAVGSAAQTAYQNGASFWKGAAAADVAGVAAIASGAAMKGIGSAAKEVTTVAQGAKLVGESFAVGAATPTIGSATNYILYNKDLLDGNGNNLYDGFGDYFVKTGGLKSAIIGGTVAAGMTSYSTYKGYQSNIPKENSTSNVNVEDTIIEEQSTAEALKIDKERINSIMESMTDEEKGKAWADYFKNEHGVDNVEHTSSYTTQLEKSIEDSKSNFARNDTLRATICAKKVNDLSTEIADLVDNGGQPLSEDIIAEIRLRQRLINDLSRDGHISDYYVEDQVKLLSGDKVRIYKLSTEDSSSLQKISDDPKYLKYVEDFRSSPRINRTITIGSGSNQQSFITDLTDEELIKFSNDYFGTSISSLKDYPIGYGVPSSSDFIQIQPNAGGTGKLVIRWGFNNGATIGLNQGDNKFVEDQILIRDGNPNGYATVSTENQVKSAVDSRALPFAEGSQTTSKFQVVETFTSHDVEVRLNNRLSQNPTDPRLKEMVDFYTSPRESWVGAYDAKNNSFSLDSSNSKVGEVCPDFDYSGGDTQYSLPLRTEDLVYLGFLKHL